MGKEDEVNRNEDHINEWTAVDYASTSMAENRSRLQRKFAKESQYPNELPRLWNKKKNRTRT